MVCCNRSVDDDEPCVRAEDEQLATGPNVGGTAASTHSPAKGHY